jgi:hypothetical protein
VLRIMVTNSQSVRHETRMILTRELKYEDTVAELCQHSHGGSHPRLSSHLWSIKKSQKEKCKRSLLYMAEKTGKHCILQNLEMI